MNTRYRAPLLLLVADQRPEATDPDEAPLRRFRIARVRYDARGLEPAVRATPRKSAGA